MSGVFKAIGSIFSPKEPKLPKVASMPDPEAPAAKAAAAAKIRDKRKNGRAGTIYDSASTTYVNQQLGGTA